MARGGKREGAGRPLGQRSAATKEQIGTITEMAQSYAVDAVAALRSIMMDETAPHSARVSAANAILDRGYGKPQQAIDHSSTDGTMTPFTRIERVIIDPAKHGSETDSDA